MIKVNKLKSSLFILFFTLIHLYALAQTEVNATGEYSFRIEPNQTLTQAKDFALEQAKIIAIENAFGRIISNGNSTYLQNSANNNQVQTKSSFSFISESFVKGEWIKDNNKPVFIFEIINDEQWLKVKVDGLIREIENDPIGFEFHTLNCPKLNCKTELYKDEQDFYVYFKSPENGYLAIYLDDPNLSETSRILPYQDSRLYEGSVKVNRDTDYLLFTKSNDLLKEIGAVDELKFKLAKSNESEQYKLYVLFSKEPFSNPLLNDNKKMVTEKNAELLLPKSLPSKQFQRWLQKFRINRKKIQVDRRYLYLVK